MRLSTKTGLVLLGLVLVAVGGSGLTSFYAWRTRHDVNHLISDRMSNTIAVAELDTLLLKQRGYVAAFIIDGGNWKWIEEQDALEPVFRTRLQDLEDSSQTGEERAMLTTIRGVFEQYDLSRDAVVRLYRQGRINEARQTYVTDVMPSYRKVSAACDALVESNRRDIRQALDEGNASMRRLSLFETVGAVLTGLLGVGLLWILSREIFVPLQRMAKDLKRLPVADEVHDGPPEGADPTALGIYLRALMSEVMASRESLAKTRREFAHSERLVALGNAVAHLAHEIKNALTTIGGFAVMIERHAHDPNRVQEAACVIRRSSDRLDRMIKEVLEFSRPGREGAQSRSINAIVAEAVAGAAPRKPEGVSIESVLDPAAPQVSAPAGSLEEVVVNLVSNAVEAMTDGGAVRVSTRANQATVEVTVSDTGPGIPPEVRARLFEPFFTTKHRGNGLGLAICRQIVADLGGDISVESAPGAGAHFKITLPRVQPDARRQ